MAIRDDKAALRALCRKRRRTLRAAAPRAGERARDLFLDAIGFPEGAVVAAYLPVGDEFDVLPLAEAASRMGRVAVMPAVEARARPLVFREWTPGLAPVVGAFGVPTPPPEAREATPTLLLVPTLAFDRRGGRLGQGGGFYDRTLAALRARDPRTLAVGVCFAGLEVDRVPREAHDERLDWIATERGVRKVRAPGTGRSR